MKRNLCLLIVCSLLLGLVACARDDKENLMTTVVPNEVEKLTNLNQDGPVVTDFALRLFCQGFEQDKNTLISPMSILQALGMTANGAKGETLRQMEDVFGLDLEHLNDSISSMDDGSGKLNLANSIWFRDSEHFTVNKDFLQTNADYYGAGFFKAPFDVGTCKEINNWVKENTEGMIPHILDSIPEDAVMYLVNALAFDARWQEIYKESDIWEGQFTTEKGVEVPVEMMHSEERLYLEDQHATGFIKYYEGGRYAFAALLPNPGMTVEEYLETLTAEHLFEMLSNPYEAKVQTSMPKFEVEYDVEMSDILKAMGMTEAFSGNKADLSGIGHSEMGNLYISRVLHKTYINVDAKGTRAGAATAVEISYGCAMEPDFYGVYLDRPFVYMLIDTEANLPFFMGAMMDPSGEFPEIVEPVLESPPDLSVICGDDTIVVSTGNCSWEAPADNGETLAFIACGSHPLDGFRTPDFQSLSSGEVTLCFPVEPDEITVLRWQGSDVGNVDAVGERVTLDDLRFALPEGEWVYEITAAWQRDAYAGQASYHLYLSRSDLSN